jgi:predicted transcriptional regulator
MVKNVQIVIRIEDDVKAEIDRLAHAQDRSSSWLAARYLREGLQRDLAREPHGAARHPGQGKRPGTRA